MASFGFKLWENVFQTIPDISFFDAESIKQFCFAKLSTAVYPPRMAPFGLKLWENVFQTIPDISFSDAESKKKNPKSFSTNHFAENFFSTSKNEMLGII